MREPLHLEIRLAEPSEAGLVHAVMTDAFAEYRAAGIPTGALSETVDEIRELLEQGREQAALCFCDGQAVGSVRFRSDGGLYFRRLAVRPAFQGRGIAKAILRWLEDYGRRAGERSVWCWVRADMARNVRLYVSAGYTETARELMSRCDGQQTLVATMKKDLTEIREGEATPDGRRIG